MTEAGGPKGQEQLACTPATANEKKRMVDEVLVKKKGRRVSRLVKDGERVVGCYTAPTA